jgi:hypothetical protein
VRLDKAGVGTGSSVTVLLIAILALVWLVVGVLGVAVCRAAARGDADLADATSAAAAGGDLTRDVDDEPRIRR